MSDITASMVKELRERTGAAMMDCKKALVEVGGDVEEAITVLRKKGIAKAAKKAGRTAAQGMIALAIADDNKSAFMAEINCETDFVGRDENFLGFATKIAQAGLANKNVDIETLQAIEVDGSSLEDHRRALVQKIGENVQLRRVAFVESSGTVGAYSHGGRIAALVAIDKDNQELAKDLAMHVAATKPQAIKPEDVAEADVNKEREIFTEQAKATGKPEEIIAKMVEGRISKFLKEVSLTGQSFVKDPNQTIASLLASHQANVLEFVRFEVGDGIEVVKEDFAAEVKKVQQG